MPSKITFTVEGLEQLTASLDKITKGIPTASKKSITESMAAGGKISDAKVPVKTGKLKKSKLEKITGDFQGEFSYNTKYAKFVDGGTVRMLARPYFTPAVQAIQKQFPTIMSKNIKTLTGAS
jgi:HK97 gp10 family phage protein